MKKETQLSHSIRLGLTGGAILTIYEFLLYVFGQLNNEGFPYVSLFILIGVIFFSIRLYRENQLNGHIEYGKAFTTGLLTAIFAGIIIGIYTYIEFKFLAPHLIEDIKVLAEEDALNRGLEPEEIEMTMSFMKFLYKPGSLSFIMVLAQAFRGALISLVLAALLKRSGNPLLDRTSNPE